MYIKNSQQIWSDMLVETCSSLMIKVSCFGCIIAINKIFQTRVTEDIMSGNIMTNKKGNEFTNIFHTTPAGSSWLPWMEKTGKPTLKFGSS